MNIQRIKTRVGCDFVRRYHYAKTTPKTVKFCHGVFHDNELVGVLLWGFGTRPLHTIRRIFPSLGTSGYLELCRLCLLDSMPRNTETQALRLSRERIMYDHPSVKLLFSWADGMRGKPGFVYQADNWLYGGYIVSEFYRDATGEVVHPRLLISRFGHRDRAFANELGLVKYRGPQFRYIRFLCGHRERKRLLRESPFQWNLPYPKAKDLFIIKEERQNAEEVSGVETARFQRAGPGAIPGLRTSKDSRLVLTESASDTGGQNIG